MMPTLRMEISHEGHAGRACRLAQETVMRLGGGSTCAEAAAIVVTELATNLVRHGHDGEILFREVKDRAISALELNALDKGPGMRDVTACLRDGHSTAGTAVTGLGAARRLSADMEIYSQPGQGTVVWARCRVMGRVASGNLIHSGISLALKDEDVCGDAWDVLDSGDGMRVILADGLGHGPLAAVAAGKAVSIFRRYGGDNPSEALMHIHQALASSRGAAASIVSIGMPGDLMTMAGVGNVTVRVLESGTSKTFGGDNGTLGSAVRKITPLRHSLEPDSVVVLHSDGISSRWSPESYPGLVKAHPALIAGVLHRDFRHSHDDSTVIVVRRCAS